jgi:BirA family biotin operon repressor/biotin-[acetyl-CoA-carboxylase] ligase
MPFENQNGERFMGIIKNVSREGKLELQIEDDSIKAFAVKEIQMLY